MSVWLWILIGGASWLVLSLVVGIAVGAILSSTSRLELSKLIDHERWTSGLPARSDQSAEEVAVEQEAEDVAGREIRRESSLRARRTSGAPVPVGRLRGRGLTRYGWQLRSPSRRS